MSGLVSIITPSYNTATFIAQTIQSVQAQTYTDWEMLIVDDCSTDQTDAVVAPFLQDDRIRYLKNERNSGAAVSRNRALREARGKWIAFLDSDDIWEPQKLEKQIAFMEQNDYALSYTAYAEIDEQGQSAGVTVCGPKTVTKRGIYRYCWLGCLTVMYNAERIGLIQVADIARNNDYAMWLKACAKADCHLLDETLACYRRGRSGSISTRSLTELIGWHYKLFRIGDQRSPLTAWFFTARNLFFGVIKKLKYVKR